MGKPQRAPVDQERKKYRKPRCPGTQPFLSPSASPPSSRAPQPRPLATTTTAVTTSRSPRRIPAREEDQVDREGIQGKSGLGEREAGLLQQVPGAPAQAEERRAPPIHPGDHREVQAAPGPSLKPHH